MFVQRMSALAVAIAVAGCQAMLSTDTKQCATDADCAAKGGVDLACVDSVCQKKVAAPSTDAGNDAATGPWACLPDPPGKPVEDRSSLTLERARYVVYSQNDCEHNRPVPGMEAKLCSQRDVSCSNPIEVAATDCEGYVNLKALYRGFEGYVLVNPPRPTSTDAGPPVWPSSVEQCFRDLAAKEAAEGKSGERCAITLSDGKANVPLPKDLLPGLVMIIPPPSVADDPNTIIEAAAAPHLISEGTIRSLVAVVGQAFDPTAGHLLAQALDCNESPAAGVTLTVTGGLTPRSQVYYTDAQGLPNTNQGETSITGETGYVNLDPGAAGLGPISVAATRQATRERIGVYGGFVRSGYVTYMPLPPLKN